MAKARLEGGAKDAGAGKGLRMYNAHLSRLQNQWINPLQSVNSGYGTAHASLFLYQPVNYYECYSLAQDPLFAKVFNVLSETPFAKGGELSNLSAEEKDRAEEAASRFDLWQHLRAAVRSNYVTGGCLLYMDFGLSGRELEEPLDLNRMNIKRFRGFRHIDPINCVAVQVNTVNPAAGDYMQPSIWYVIGLGAVHRSHFLKFEANIPELPMRPLTLYFGMPLTQLIKQDVANSNLASQGLANLMNRFRFTYLKADESSFTTENAKCFKDRLNFMSFVQDNFGVCPIKTTEDVMQLTTSLAGMAENVEEFYLLISAKTDIPYTELMGKSAEGMNATGSGDRRKWYDKCRSIQESVKNNLLFMYGIVAGIDSGKFVKFTDFTFNPLEEATEKELAENIKSYAEVASALVNLGAKQDEVFEWLKQFKQFNLDGLSFDTETEGLGGYEDITPQVMSEFQAANERREEDHPRGKDGKFGQGGGDNEKDRKADVEEKISKIKIDFTKDNILPELNAGDLEELGVKSKPVLLKKTVIDRNLSQHPDVEVEDYEMMIGKALYDADAILPGNAEKPYYNFIARVSGEKNSVVLLEVADNKDNFEIVHFHWAKNKQRRTLEKKAERIKEKS